MFFCYSEFRAYALVRQTIPLGPLYLFKTLMKKHYKTEQSSYLQDCIQDERLTIQLVTQKSFLEVLDITPAYKQKMNLRCLYVSFQ